MAQAARAVWLFSGAIAGASPAVRGSRADCYLRGPELLLSRARAFATSVPDSSPGGHRCKLDRRMKLVWKTTLAMLFGICIVLAGHGYLRVVREISFIRADMTRDHFKLGQAFSEAVDHLWRAKGKPGALQLIEDANAARTDEELATADPLEEMIRNSMVGASVGWIFLYRPSRKVDAEFFDRLRAEGVYRDMRLWESSRDMALVAIACDEVGVARLATLEGPGAPRITDTPVSRRSRLRPKP